MSKNESGKLNFVKRFNRGEKASQNSISLDLIKNVFCDAIEYRGIPLGTRGMASTMGLLCLSMAIWADYMILSTTNPENIFMHIFDLTAVAAFSAFGVFTFLKMIRIELFQPEDAPIIFERKHRKIYRIYSNIAPGWMGLLKRWPMKFAEYSWDLVDAEHHAQLNVNTASASRIHELLFLVRKSHMDPSVVDAFSVGNGLVLGEVTVAPVWEHIRRFMEENGPQLPLGETLRAYHKPKNFKESVAGAVNLYFGFWKEYRFLAIILTLLFPITLPGAVLITIFSWLSYKTAIPVQWPQHVLDTIGLPLDDQSKADQSGKLPCR